MCGAVGVVRSFDRANYLQCLMSTEVEVFGFNNLFSCGDMY